MALSVDWAASIIDVPQSDLTYVVADDVYVLDSDAFRLELKELEANLSEGIPFLKTHDHNTEVSLAGTTFARQVIVLPPYQVRFENTGSAYTVRVEGSNNNIIDPAILIPTPLVSYVATNSAGLIVRESGTSGLTPTESANLTLILELMRAGHITPDGQVIIELRDGTTYTTTAWEDVAGTVPHTGGAIRHTDPISDTPDP